MPKDKSKKRLRLEKKTYEHHLAHLQEELVKLQEWVKQEGLKVVVLFEGRDAAGKGASSRRSPSPQPPGLPGHGAARPRIASAPSGTFSATWRTCPPPARWCCSTAPGTTGPGSSE
jgi:hypothetical protein